VFIIEQHYLGKVSLFIFEVSIFIVEVSVVVLELVAGSVDILFIDELSDLVSEPVAVEVVSHEAKPMTNIATIIMLFIICILIY